MPLIQFHVIEGRPEAEIKAMLDAGHEAVLEAFAVPQDDRYQLVTEYKPGRMVLLDTGLGFTRGPSPILVQVFSSPRSEEQKQAFYDILCRKLETAIGLDPKDLMVSVMSNTRADWSFGFGRAQFLTGEL
ncbi:tautomerase family protein [Thioclava sp. GXIMD4216]|uniref:Tautomerase family protein n=1 Tax=Thioclava litoralis TaxID=3076557 RepID=A0ABZ1E1B6_9RHOB|nr:tautomerase family protein [Thioclava sp. FTW29]